MSQKMYATVIVLQSGGWKTSLCLSTSIADSESAAKGLAIDHPKVLESMNSGKAITDVIVLEIPEHTLRSHLATIDGQTKRGKR